MREVALWCDGSGTTRGNPGGWGTILICNDVEKELFGGALDTTNNQMELTACIRGFEALKFPCKVTVHSDSEYVIKAFTHNWIAGWVRKHWRGVKNMELWQSLIAVQQPHEVTWTWVKGHSKIRLNERCDKLAKEARWAVEAAVKQDAPLDMLDFEVIGQVDGQLEFA